MQRHTELKFIRISRYDSEKADNEIKQIEKDIKQTKHDLDHLVDYAIAYFERIKSKYAEGKERRTEIREFDTIEAWKVASSNAKLYVDRAEGFFGFGKSMKDSEFVCDCSNLDDVIIILKDGRYKITKISEKAFFDKGIHYIGIYKRNDERTIYNMLYRDGRGGAIMMKRCAIKSVTRDKEYDLTKGTAKSELLYLSVNPNGEAEILKLYLRPRARLKKCIIDLDLSTLAIKGRQSVGNLVTRYPINKIVLKERCASTLGGQNIWYDEDVRRLNTDGRGMLLGEFKGEDKIVVWTAKNQYYITGFDVQQHFPDDTIRVERYIADRVYSVCYYDGELKYYYMKRFQLEAGDKTQFFLDEGSLMRFVAMTYRKGAQLEVTFGGQHEQRPVEMVDVDEFIAVKSHRARGKRITNYEVAQLRFIEPEEPEMEDDELDDEPLVDDEGMDAVIEDEAIDMDDIVGEEITADPNVDYNERAEAGELFGASQLNLF